MRNLLFIFFIISFLKVLPQDSEYPWYDCLFCEHIHKIDEPIFYIDSCHQMRYEGEEWIINRRYKLNDRNLFGLMLNGKVFNINDEISGQITGGYSNLGDLNFYLDELWNTDSMDWVLQEKQTWNQYGGLVENRDLFWLIELPSACSGYGELLYYDTNNNVIEERRLSWHLLGGWGNRERHIYSYDCLGLMEESIYEDWDHNNNAWVGTTKWNYFYENNNNTYCYIYIWDTGLEVWEKLWKRTHVFDTNDFLIEVKYCEPMSDSTYENYGRWTYLRNQFGKEVEQIQERYDTVTNEWKNDYIYNWNYLNDTIMTMHSSVKWKEEIGAWQNVFRRTWEYNDDLKFLYKLFESGQGFGWENDEQDIFEYNTDGNIIRYERYRWKYDINHEGYWAPQNREDYFWPGFIGESEYNETENDIIIYPNPVSDYLNIVCESEIIKSIQIFNVLGIEVYNTNEVSKEISLDISSYPKGTYLVNITTVSNIISKKVIVQK